MSRVCVDCGGPIIDVEGDLRCDRCGLEVEDVFTLDVRTAREISELPEPDATDLLLGPLVVRGARTIIVAASGHGKTTLANQMVSGVLTGWDVLGFDGSGVGPALIIDLEQGRRSIKRTLWDSGLHDREDVFVVAVPDGLALDSDDRHRDEIERIVAETMPAVVVLDPYYKAHRGEANEERGVVDLMRHLDALRARYGFALILPAHPRKDQTGRSNGARKLTLDDVAGSGAVTRGAELVIGLERLSHGFARLRILKDRDHDLAVGDEWPLLFSRGEGFRRDPKAEGSQEEDEARVLELGSDGEWRTCKDYADVIKIRTTTAKKILEGLAETGRVEVAVGPPGRSPKARCYRTVPDSREQSGTVAPSASNPDDCSTVPDVYKETSEPGTVGGGVKEVGSVAGTVACSRHPDGDGPTWCQDCHGVQEWRA